VVGVSKQGAQKVYLRALRRNTDQDIQTVHRSELVQGSWRTAESTSMPPLRLRLRR
jgi:hypothetical protein